MGADASLAQVLQLPNSTNATSMTIGMNVHQMTTDFTNATSNTATMNNDNTSTMMRQGNFTNEVSNSTTNENRTKKMMVPASSTDGALDVENKTEMPGDLRGDGNASNNTTANGTEQRNTTTFVTANKTEEE